LLPIAGLFITTISVSISSRPLMALASTNLPWSCYCLKAQIPEKRILLPQLTAYIKLTLKCDKNPQ